MKILVNDYSGHPFQVELSRELASRGHQVLHLYSADFVTPKGDLVRRESDPASFCVQGIATGETFTKYDFLKRRGQEIKYAIMVCDRISDFRPNVVVGCNNPLDAQKKILSFCRNSSLPFVFWLQDLYSIAIKSILKAKLSWPGTLIGFWYERMEKNLLRRASHIIPISEDFLPQLLSWNLQKDRITVIENWASLNKIVPMAHETAWRASHKLDGKQLVLYTGTIGLKHNPDLLLAAAKAFGTKPEVCIVAISEGKYADYLREKAQAQSLVNLLVLPFQPFSVYSEVLASADILLAMIEPEAAIYSVPSKVLSYLCSGRPIVLSAPPGNLAAKTVIRAGAGHVVAPDDHDGFVAAIEYYFLHENESNGAGSRARAYAEQHFDIKTIADRFEAVFQKCQAGAR